MAHFKTNDTDIFEILQDINKGKIQLPEFQRDWTWDDNRIRALIASIVESYPVGALTFMEFGGEAKFKYRPIEGCHDILKDKKPESLILDGQQRLTSLYNAFHSQNPVQTKTEKGKEVKRFYYLDIAGYFDPDADRIDSIISIPDDRIEKEDFGRKIIRDLSSREKEFEQHMLPLNLVFDQDKFREWERGYQKFHNNEDQVLGRLDNIYKEAIAPIIRYKVPVITLTKEVSKSAVCQVFEKVNTGGVALTMFEIVVAIFAADDFDLRKDWDKRYGTLKEEYPVLKTFAQSPENFLIAVILLARHQEGKKPLTFKRNDILKLTLEDYKQHAAAIEDGFGHAARFLHEERIFNVRELPYAAQLIPMAVLFAILGKSLQDKTKRDKLSQWFWCGIFGELYGVSAESRFAKDITGILDWMNGGDAPDTVKQASFSALRLLELRTRTNVPYKGITALILKNDARDFVSGSRIDHTLYLDQNIDIHHIFPKAWCRDKFQEVKWDSVINKTPLSMRSNRDIIRGDAPSVYLNRIVKSEHVQTDAELDELLQSHLIDASDMRTDDFASYFIKRAKALLKLIEESMGKEITGLDSQEVIDAYGMSLKE